MDILNSMSEKIDTYSIEFTQALDATYRGDNEATTKFIADESMLEKISYLDDVLAEFNECDFKKKCREIQEKLTNLYYSFIGIKGLLISEERYRIFKEIENKVKVVVWDMGKLLIYDVPNKAQI